MFYAVQPCVFVQVAPAEREIAPLHLDRAIEVVEKLRDQIPQARIALTYTGRADGDADWVRHEHELCEFSRLYPDLVLTLFMRGRDPISSLRVKYFHNGKVHAEYRQTDFPEFDESKLRESVSAL